MRGRIDLASLVGGLSLIAIGILLLLDSTGDVDLTAGWSASMVLAGLGATLLASGMNSRR